MNENKGKRDLQINQLKEENVILNKHLNEHETVVNETLQILADADCLAIKLSENKA